MRSQQHTDNARIVGNAEAIREPCSAPRGQNGRPESWQGTSSPNSLIFCRGCRGTGRVSAKLNLLKKTTFYNLRVSEFTSALSLVRGETGTRFGG